MSGAKSGSGFVLKLFISGASPKSLRAVSNLRSICEKAMSPDLKLEIIDVYKNGELASKEQIVALPMLVKKFPLPERKLIGDLSDLKKVLESLGLAL